MSISDNNKARISIKHLSGKSNTDVDKEVGNEAEGIFFNVRSKDVWANDIDPDPAQAVIAGVAQAVTADMIEDATSNGHAFFAVYSSTISFGIGVLSTGTRYVAVTTAVHDGNSYNTGEAFTATNDDLTSGTVKEMVKNVIPPSHGDGYEAKPFDGGTPIPVGDPRDWIFQYNSGVFFQQDNVGNDPTTIQFYIYVGLTGGGGGGGGVLNKTNKSLVPSATSGDNQTTGLVIGEVPLGDGYIQVQINGNSVSVGDGVKTEFCYFSGDGGTTARALTAITATDVLYWNGVIAGYDLDGNDRVDLNYII